MIRTMWLGLACLIALLVLATVRLVTKTSADNTSSLSLTTAPAPPVASGDGTLTKGDRLELFHPSENPSIPAIPSVTASKPPETAVKIISRHWHDSFAKQPSAKPHSRDAKTMTPKD
jgi:hypothetical protein